MRAHANYDEQELLFSYGVQASHCGGFSCGAQALGTPASVVQHVGSVVVVHGLNLPCKNFFFGKLKTLQVLEI